MILKQTLLKLIMGIRVQLKAGFGIIGIQSMEFILRKVVFPSPKNWDIAYFKLKLTTVGCMTDKLAC